MNLKVIGKRLRFKSSTFEQRVVPLRTIRPLKEK